MTTTIAGAFTDAGFSTAPNQAGALIFCPTYRFLETDATGSVTQSASARQSQYCYYRGVKETILFTVSGPAPVRWRRIVFETQQSVMAASFYTSVIPGVGGRARPMSNLAGAAEFVTLTELIFKGVQTADWNNIFDAKIDTQRIKIHSDKSRVLNPGNASGKTTIHKQWTALNKTLIYGDDELGDDEVTNPFCASTNKTLGNIFIVDFFEPTIGGTGTQINFNPQTTVYWHEK